MNDIKFEEFVKSVDWEKMGKTMASLKIAKYEDIAPDGGFPLCDGYPFSRDNEDKFFI